jgi:hypothetical protein
LRIFGRSDEISLSVSDGIEPIQEDGAREDGRQIELGLDKGIRATTRLAEERQSRDVFQFELKHPASAGEAGQSRFK